MNVFHSELALHAITDSLLNLCPLNDIPFKLSNVGCCWLLYGCFFRSFSTAGSFWFMKSHNFCKLSIYRCHYANNKKYHKNTRSTQYNAYGIGIMNANEPSVRVSLTRLTSIPTTTTATNHCWWWCSLETREPARTF